jgi:hypothetical protein
MAPTFCTFSGQSWGHFLNQKRRILRGYEGYEKAADYSSLCRIYRKQGAVWKTGISVPLLCFGPKSQNRHGEFVNRRGSFESLRPDHLTSSLSISLTELQGWDTNLDMKLTWESPMK